MADALFTTLLNHGGQSAPSQTATNQTLDANNDGWGHAFRARSADAITHLGFRYGARTGTPPEYSIRLESVDGSGMPDGADVGGGAPTAKTFTPPADATWDGTWRWVQLTNAFTPSRGQLFASTIRYSSGTVDGSNNSSFTTALSGFKSARGFPYANTLTAGTWAITNNGVCFGYRTASGRYGYISTGLYATTTSTSGNRSAMHFTLPSGWGATYQLAFPAMYCRCGATGTSCKIGLWAGDGSVLQEITVDADTIDGPNTWRSQEFFFDEATLATLDFGTKYYLGVESVSSSTVGIRGWQLAEAEDRSAFPNGVNRGLATWNGSAWTEDNTVMPICELGLADITEPSAGGGLIVNPGMGGRLI